MVFFASFQFLIMGLYKNKYRIESIRLKEWDYQNPWWYYVTINTKNHYPWFGDVANGKMLLNKIGKIVENEWKKTVIIRRNVDLDYFVVMPNHIHGIIIIREGQAEGLHYSLQQIIGSYKNVATKDIRQKVNKDFAWQPSFYDHVTRKEESLEKIREYIKNNPLKWELDRNNISNLWM